jgi:S-DNA-T family DNA segregation ATPase FtsK/SpoIIIE
VSDVPVSTVVPDDRDGGDRPIEGTVVPFPGAPPAAAPAKPQRGQPGELRDIIPPHLRTWQGIRKAVRWHRKRAQHSVLYHAVRSPKRLVLTLGWALVGVARLVFAQLGWWWVSEQAYLRHEAVAAADSQKWLSLHKHVREVRLVRGLVLLGEVLGLALAAALVTSYVPLAWLPVSVVAVPLLAWIGRPADKPIVTSAVVPVALERLSKEVIVRALGSIGISELNKALTADPENAVVLIDPITATAPAGWPGSTCRTV